MRYKKPKQLLLILCLSFSGICHNIFAQNWNPNHLVGTIDGNYNFSYNQTPSPLVEIFQAAFPNTGLTYQWESSTTPIFPVNPPAVGTQATYTFPAALTQNMWFRRKTTYTANGNSIYSNIIKISVVSVNWEDINYIREHDVLTTGITTWTAIDQLTIGSKLQTTTYLDGLGRSVEKVSRETATPPSNPNDLWGDMVQFSEFDAYGREVKKYLPYTTLNQSGKFKTTTSAITDQAAYYTAAYNETAPYSFITFDNSPLNRVKNVKSPGTSWAAAAGNSADYDMNTVADDVKIFTVDYIKGNAPYLKYSGPSLNVYPANSLYKLTYTDENGKKVVEFISKAGQVIEKKVQLEDNPMGPYIGWISTYNVYDDFGLLRFQIQPEGVNYLANNGWSFSGANGAMVFAEQVFQYWYDDKGRTIWKKAPGAAPLNMIYDGRDRLVFMQDGNQATMTTPQWTGNIFDELDRTVIVTLYNTAKSISQLQTDINNGTTGSINIANPNQPVINLVINNRQINITRYAAQNSIEFVSDANGSFESTPADEFTAEIDPTTTSAGYSVASSTYKNPISSTDLNNPAVCTVLKYLFYDNYFFSGVKSFDNNFTNTAAYNTSDPNVQPIVKSDRTISMSTGSLTRVLGTNTFLASTRYYDEKGRLIQSLEDNIKAGVNITTLQYHFDGRTMSSCSDHTAPGTGYTNFKTLTKYIFDKLGRVTSIQKQFGTNAFKTVLTYDYDDVGRVKTKHLDPSYTNPNTGLPDLESLSYSFNIHNQITGINKDYALKTPATYDKWTHFFGMYLGFDNRDNLFTARQLNGQVAGIFWNTQGDDAQRKYEYTYDNAGRLINAFFKEKQHSGDTWANNKMDFSVSGSSGQITYDLNGNLLTMLQKGVLPGSTSPVVVDDLLYTYNSYSNKLSKVSDNTPLQGTGANGHFGDFKDGTNATNSDYVYDNNGNVVIDLNKNAKDLNNVVGANGIRYNYLDKPDQIRIAGKGTIDILYNADGEKLKRTFTPEGAGTATTTTYINEFVYQGDNLSFINFEEGRIRVIKNTWISNGYDALTIAGNMILPKSLSGDGGVYDYFITDYQRNVRMILTEETHIASNTCTMETPRATNEDLLFGQNGTGNEVEATRYPTTSTSWTGNTTASVSRLGNLSGHNIGPNTLQKVMAGDRVAASVQYYYQSSSGNGNTNFLNNLLSSLAQAISGGPTTGVVKENVTNINNQLNTNAAFSSAVQPTGSGGTTPQAWLTILFFDERFNFIEVADGGVAQIQVATSVGSGGLSLTLPNVKAPKNGYAFVYLSNRSDQDVYFDNLQVGITAGNIIEENHYYAYGLKITTISSKKLGDSYEGTLDNKYLYNDKELIDDADLNWYDYGFRNYDPQIGRFTQLDPLTFSYPFYTPYQFAGDEPIGNVDVDGLEPAGATSLFNNLSKQGINSSMRLLEKGVNAGKWAVSWVSEGVAHSTTFASKAVGAVSAAARIAATVGALSNATNSILGPKISLNPNPPQAAYTPFQMWNPDDHTITTPQEEQFYEDPNCYCYEHPELLQKYAWYWGLEKVAWVLPVEKVFVYGGKGAVWAWRTTRAAKVAKKVKQGIAVLGKYPDYINLASELGARRFNIPVKIWNKMTAAEQWGANMKFLDRAIARGDKFILSNPVKNINNVTGSFRRELDYLIEKGYKISKDGTQLIK